MEYSTLQLYIKFSLIDYGKFRSYPLIDSLTIELIDQNVPRIPERRKN